jgi:hypothetical protein
MISFMLPSIFNLLVTFIRCCTDLMMCSIHIDESVIHVLTVARSSRFCVPFSERLDNLLDRLDNRRTIRGSWNDTLEWVRNQNDTHYYSGVTAFRDYKYLICLTVISHSFSFSLSVLPASSKAFMTTHQRTKEHSDYYGRTSQSKNYIRNKQDHWVVSNWTFYL